MIGTWEPNEGERRVRDIVCGLKDMGIGQNLAILCAINPNLIEYAPRARQLLSMPTNRAGKNDEGIIEEMERAFTRLRSARMPLNATEVHG